MDRYHQISFFGNNDIKILVNLGVNQVFHEMDDENYTELFGAKVLPSTFLMKVLKALMSAHQKQNSTKINTSND